jgi:predicted nuclease with TOPRIM domain
MLEAERVKARKLEARLQEFEVQVADIPSFKDKIASLEAERAQLQELADRLPSAEAGELHRWFR